MWKGTGGERVAPTLSADPHAPKMQTVAASSWKAPPPATAQPDPEPAQPDRGIVVEGYALEFERLDELEARRKRIARACDEIISRLDKDEPERPVTVRQRLALWWLGCRKKLP